MRDMTVMRVRFRVFFRPFHDSPVGTDRGWHQARALFGQFRSEFPVNAKNPGRFNAGAKEVAQHLSIDRCSKRNCALVTISHAEMIFRGIRWSSREPVMFWVFNQHVSMELRGTFHNRIGPLEKFSIM